MFHVSAFLCIRSFPTAVVNLAMLLFEKIYEENPEMEYKHLEKDQAKPDKRPKHTHTHKTTSIQHTFLSSFLQASTTNTKTQEESPESPSVESRICLQIGHLLLPGIMVNFNQSHGSSKTW